MFFPSKYMPTTDALHGKGTTDEGGRRAQPHDHGRFADCSHLPVEIGLSSYLVGSGSKAHSWMGSPIEGPPTCPGGPLPLTRSPIHCTIVDQRPQSRPT